MCGDLLTCRHRQFLGFQPARQIIPIKLYTVQYLSVSSASDLPRNRVADLDHLNADPDPAFHFYTDPDPEPTFHFNEDSDPSHIDANLRTFRAPFELLRLHCEQLAFHGSILNFLNVECESGSAILIQAHW